MRFRRRAVALAENRRMVSLTKDLTKPAVALTLGDPAGIGSELMAKLLVRHDLLKRANVVLVGDPWLWEEGQAIAGVKVGTRTIHSFDQVRSQAADRPFFLPLESV